MTSVDTVVLTKMRVLCPKESLAEKLQLAGRGVDDGQVPGLDGAAQARVGRSVAGHMRTYVRGAPG